MNYETKNKKTKIIKKIIKIIHKIKFEINKLFLFNK
jgi:hypothetical protein